MATGKPRLLDDLSGIDPNDRGTYDGYAMLRRCQEGTTRDGKAFADVELCDQTTTVRGKIWSEAKEALSALKDLSPGDAIKVRFEPGSYQGALQLIIKQLRAIDESDKGYRAEAVFGEGINLVEDLICQTLVFDIETVPATNRRKLPNTVAESLGKFADRKDMDTNAAMGLSPFFGKVVSLAIGEGDVEDIARQRVTVLAVPPAGQEDDEYPDWMRPMTEADLIRAFWILASAAETVVTFNGRGFDVPFLVGRSLVHGIPARVDLMGNRYALRPHLDLYTTVMQARGMGPGSLDTICWALGIESPKGEMDGSMVAPAYEKGNIEEIAEYNAADVIATTRVYQRVRDLVLRYRTDW